MSVPYLLNELDMPPCDGAELSGIIVAGTCPVRFNCWQLVPLLAGHFAGFAADTETGIGEKAQGSLRW